MLQKFLGFILLVFSVWLLLLATGWSFPYKIIIYLMDWFRASPLQSVGLAAAALTAGVYFFRGRRTGNEKIRLLRMDAGEIRISRAALEEMIAKSVSGVSGLERIKVNVKQEAGGLTVKCYCRQDHRFALTSGAGKIQEKIQRDIEEYAGIKVEEVKVLVSPKGLTSGYGKNK
jgi:uncharacterized alkaline shock family protein YloU